MSNTNTTFWELLSKKSIEIPIIQRDYAQGRIGKENLRKRFLKSILSTLKYDKSLKLDFVYGSINSNNKFQPLDGQQRLTTLWLMHWYIALRAGQLDDTNCKILRKFSYETRVSSREFCEELCTPDNFKDFGDDDKIVPYITNSTWFYSSWNQDPTIKAMLVMIGGTNITTKNQEPIIDGLEELFAEDKTNDFEQYWKKLTTDRVIEFSYLHLKDFGLSDDLYIKMNARGKALTPFENFKADLINCIQNQNEYISGTISEEILSPNNGFAKKMDTDWMNIFWQNKKSNKTVDEIYYTFVNRFFWNELFTAKNSNDQYILDVNDGKETTNSSYRWLNADNGDGYNDFQPYLFGEESKIPASFFDDLTKILDNYKKYYDNGGKIPQCGWDSTFCFIPEYKKEDDNNIKVLPINQGQRIVFFALCKYFKDGEGDEQSLKRWLRVVWNLVSSEDINGTATIRNTQAVRAAVNFIQSIDSHNVYDSLSKIDIAEKNSAFDKRCKEEIVKAEKILNSDEKFEEAIIKAENSLFFKGSIRFLYHNENGNIDWGEFDAKWEKVNKYFDKNGLKEDFVIDVIKKFVSQYNIEDIKDYEIFNSKGTTWNWILNNEKYQAGVHCLLTQNLTEIKDVHGWPFEHMITDGMFGQRGRFHYAYNIYAFYKPYGSNALLLDQIGFQRNGTLCKLSEDISFETNQRIEGTKYFSGWDIVFKYKERYFVWKRDNNIYHYNNLEDVDEQKRVGEQIYFTTNSSDEIIAAIVCFVEQNKNTK
jgi:hypothetical protein